MIMALNAIRSEERENMKKQIIFEIEMMKGETDNSYNTEMEIEAARNVLTALQEKLRDME